MKSVFTFLTLLGSGVLLTLSPDTSAQTLEKRTFPGTLLLPEGTSDPVRENPDRRAGDSAFTAGDYPVAVSFYTKYLLDSRKKKDLSLEKDAYERLLDALILGKFTQSAEKYLKEYEVRFPGGDQQSAESHIWRGEILFQQKKYAEAEQLYRKLSNLLPAQDPRRFRVTWSLGMALEKQKRYKEAAGIFLPLWNENKNNSRQSKKLFQHSILCLAAAKEWDKARDLLLEYPPSPEENESHALLGAYIFLQQHGAGSSSGIWKQLLDSFRKEKNELRYIVASSYGDAFVKTGDLLLAQNSYRAAFHASVDNANAQETLSRMILVLSAAGDIQKAAALAASQLELFTHAMLKADLKLRTADLLRDSGKTKEALTLYESVFANIGSSAKERTRALYEYALLLGKNGRTAEAFRVIRSNFSGRDALEGEFLLGEILVRLKLKKEFLKQYDRIAELSGKHTVKALMLCARACVDQNMAKEALEKTARVRTFLKNDLRRVPELYYIEAAAHTALRRQNEAISLYKKYLQAGKTSDASYPVALYHTGTLAFLSGDYPEAIRQLNRLKKEYPRHALIPEASVWLIQIQSLLNNEMYVARETLFLAEKYPDSEYALDCLFRLAQRYVTEGSETKAIQVLSELIANKRFPKIQARALYELARHHDKTGKTPDALACLRKLYESFPDMDVIADAYYLHGDILRKQGDFNGAISFYRKVSVLQKDTPLAAAALGSEGDCLYTIGAMDPHNSADIFKKAVASYRAMQKIRDCPPVFEGMGYYRTGRCLEALGQKEKAALEYLKVLHKFPAHQSQLNPAAAAWGVRAAERLIDLSRRTPLRSNLSRARSALHWLCDAGHLERTEAARRFEKLKSNLFNP